MTRSWRSVLAFSLFCSMGGSAMATAPAVSPTQRVFGAYKKTYAKLPARAAKTYAEVNLIDRSVSGAFNYDTRSLDVMTRLANAGSKEALLAEERKAIIEYEIAAHDQTQPHGTFKEMFGKKPPAFVPSEARVQEKLDNFSRGVDDVIGRVATLDQFIAKMPRYLTRGMQVGTIAGNEKLKTPEARQALYADVLGIVKAYTASPSKGALRMESLLQTRYTQQLNESQAAQQAHYKTAPAATLYAEAMQLVQDVNEGASSMKQRTEDMHGAVDSKVSSSSRTVSRAELATPLGTFRSPVSHVGVSNSSSAEKTQITTEELANGNDYTIVLSDAKLPTFHSEMSMKSNNVRTPFEARLVLEKVVRITEIAAALHDKDPGLATLVSAWVNSTRILVREPVRPEYNRYAATQAEPWATTTLIGSRIKPDLSKQGDKSFFEPTRATSFGTKVASNIASDLK